jgi:hypothetical protein
MRHWNRALATLVAAAAAGLLLWFVPHFHRWTTGGYWGVIALTAGAGVLVGLSQLHGRDGNPRASFLLAFLPVLVAAGWVILATQPHGGWIRDHVRSWSGDLGIDQAVHNLGEHVAVLAFGLGVVFGLMFEPTMLRRRPERVLAVPTAAAAIDEPPPEEPPATQPETDDQRPEAPPA